MAVRIRLSRVGKKNAPVHHIVVADMRKPRDGNFVEVLGTYDPRNKDEAKRLVVNKERVEYWKSKGATATDTVSMLISTL